jgi:hypothetical protein
MAEIPVKVNGGQAFIDVPNSILTNDKDKNDAIISNYIAELEAGGQFDRNSTRAGTRIVIGDSTPMTAPQHNYNYPPADGPVPAGRYDVNYMLNPDQRDLIPESGYEGLIGPAILNIPGAAEYIVDNPLLPPVLGGLATGTAASQFFRGSSFSPIADAPYPADPDPRSRIQKLTFAQNPNVLRGTDQVMERFNALTPDMVRPGDAIPEGQLVKPGQFNVGFEDSAVTYNVAGAGERNKALMIKHIDDFATTYGIKLPDVTDKINAGDLDGALADVTQAVDNHQKSTFSKAIDKLSKNYNEGGVKQVAKKTGAKLKDVPKNALNATLDAGKVRAGVAGGLGVGVAGDILYSLANLGEGAEREAQLQEAQRLREFSEAQSNYLIPDTEELEALKRLYNNPETRWMLQQ